MLLLVVLACIPFFTFNFIIPVLLALDGAANNREEIKRSILWWRAFRFRARGE